MLQREKHEMILSKILFDLMKHPALKGLLGFKGGTACYFLYNLPRFSTDLDFTLIEVSKEKVIYEAVLEVLRPYGQVKQSFDKRWTLFFLLSYEEESHNIKVELSKRRYPDDRFELKQYMGLPLWVMEKPVMAAHKLVAVTDRLRMVNRDLFDVHFFLKNHWPIDASTVKFRTGKELSSYLKSLARVLRTNPPKQLLDGIGELIDEKQKKWVKTNLVEELLYFLELRAKAIFDEGSGTDLN
jgi:predicted nucleotidyltransferase component of viral defense system